MTGKIKNAGTTACRTPSVILGLYMADGKLYRTQSKWPDKYSTEERARAPRPPVSITPGSAYRGGLPPSEGPARFDQAA